VPVEIAPFDRFSCFMAQKTGFRDDYILFGVRTKNLNIFHYSSQRYAELHCTLIITRFNITRIRL